MSSPSLTPLFAPRGEPRTRKERLRARLARAAAPAPLRRLAEIPLTVTGLGVIDWGVFTQSFTAGLIVSGLSLIGLEYLITDPE